MIDKLNNSSKENLKSRINNLTKDTHPKWGKMNAAEVMQHLKRAMEVPMEKRALKKPPFFVKLLWGKKIKKAITSDEMYGKNLPTSPDFVVNDKGLDFEKERKNLLDTIEEFVSHEDKKLEDFKHPLLGKMTADEWRKSQWKHLHHHLTQFGV